MSGKNKEVLEDALGLTPRTVDQFMRKAVQEGNLRAQELLQPQNSVAEKEHHWLPPDQQNYRNERAKRTQHRGDDEQ